MQIDFLDILYKGAMLFAIFYGAIVITKFFSSKQPPETTEEKEEK